MKSLELLVLMAMGQTEFIQAITGLIPTHQGKVMLNGKDITKASIRKKI